MGREDAEEKPRGSAGIAEVDDIVGFGETADPDPVDQPIPVLAPVDAGAHQAQRRRRRQHILAFEEAADFGAADGEGAQHQGTVRDRLVAGHADRAGQRRSRTRGGQRRRGAEKRIVRHSMRLPDRALAGPACSAHMPLPKCLTAPLCF